MKLTECLWQLVVELLLDRDNDGIPERSMAKSKRSGGRGGGGRRGGR